MIGSSIAILAPPGRGEEAPRFLEFVSKGDSIAPFDTVLRGKEGRDIDVTLSISPIRNSAGEIVGASAIARDIRQRKQAERALQDAEKKYRDIFEGALEGFYQTSFEGRSLIANPALVRMLGYDSPEEYMATINDSAHDVWVDPGERERLILLLEEQGIVRNFECRFKRKDGAVIWVSLKSRMVYDSGGKALINEGFIEDITERKRAEILLRDSEERYRTVFQMNLDSVDICRLDDGTFIDVNDAFLSITGFEREEIIGHTALEVGIWANPEDRQKLLDAMRLNSTCRNLEFPYRTKDGRLRLGRMTVTPIELDGAPCILSVTRDITEARAAEESLAKAQEALRASEIHYRTIFQTSIDGIAISRLDDGTFIEVNQAFLNIVNYEREEIIGRTSTELGVWTDDRIRQDIAEVLRRDSYFRNLTVPYKRKNGEIFWLQLSASAIEIDGVPCIISITRDTSEIRAAEERIEDLSFRDPLTHLPNRRLLLDQLQLAPGGGDGDSYKRALLFINLDEFKKLNDVLGHQTGDFLLQEAALRLIACVRGADTVARCGGDDFAVILDDLGEIPEPASTHAKKVAEKIRVALGQPYMLDGHECHCPCSIGITVFGDEPESAEQVYQHAELAMHRAKASGRNTTHFFVPALQSAANARAAIEEDLYKAIQADQFLLYYQPQVEEGRLIGAESLIRWNHPSRSLMDPEEFIPLAEETGLILPLGDWSLNTACAQIAAWAQRKQMKHIPIAVNISARQFRQPEFVEQVLAALYRTGANPQNLKLEITESMLLDNIEDVIPK
jgi:diguanylate cyclase (GGDEF)-like protein/PAS domain S-box-containing protein